MRNGVALTVLFALFIFLIPLFSLREMGGVLQSSSVQDADFTVSAQSEAVTESSVPTSDEAEKTEQKPLAEPSGTVSEIVDDGYRIRDLSTGKVMTISARDYTRGSLAAEMPPTFHPEALKAQAVASHTYALYVKQKTRENDAEAAEDFTVETENWKGFVTESLFRERYGALADVYWQTICEAADEVSRYLVAYENRPIVAAYHSMSGGVTEDASNVWMGGEPYLVPVESRGDTLAPDYRTEQRFTKEAVAAALRSMLPKAVLDEGNPAGWLRIDTRSEGGYVTKLAVGEDMVRGVELRSALELRSANFEIAYVEGAFVFTVKGYGHGVGLSQYGADYMARQGAAFDAILLHYYDGAQIIGVAQS